MACKSCHGLGYQLWVWPNRKPIPAYWFTRGPKGERPCSCDDCDYHHEKTPSTEADGATEKGK